MGQLYVPVILRNAREYVLARHGFCQLVEAKTLIERTDSLSWSFPAFKQPTLCP